MRVTAVIATIASVDQRVRHRLALKAGFPAPSEKTTTALPRSLPCRPTTGRVTSSRSSNTSVPASPGGFGLVLSVRKLAKRFEDEDQTEASTISEFVLR